jgi:hypothetical protein
MASNTIIIVDVASEYNTPQFTLGEQFTAPDGKTYRFVRAQAAKTIGLIYGIDETWEVSSTGLVKTETKPLLGIPAQTSSAPAAGFTYKYFWIQTAGNFARIEASAASADNASCFSTSTAGKVDDGDDSGYRIRGLIFTAAAGSATNTTGFSANELLAVPVA